LTEIPQFLRQNFQTEKNEWNDSHSTPVKEFTEDIVGAFWGYGTETYLFSQNSFSHIISDFRHFERDAKESWLDRKRFTETAVKLLKECRDSP
jgi:hypothetical protein